MLMKDPQSRQISREQLVHLEIAMSSFIPRNRTEIETVIACTFASTCHPLFRMLSCLQINCQPFYLRQLLKFHPFDWLIEMYFPNEGQGTH